MGCDVAIVGGGIIGCGIGLRLAQAGLRVCILERSTPGSEASSAAAGVLAAQLEAERPSPFLELCLRSRELYPQFAEELEQASGISVGYLPSGVLRVAFEQEDLQALKDASAWQRAHGLRVEELGSDQLRKLEPTLAPTAIGALHFPDDHQVDNRQLVRALSIAAERAGAIFQTGFVRGVASQADRVTGIDVEGELLAAEVVVVAAGAWSGLVQGVRIDPRAVRPARGQMVQLQVRAPEFSKILCSKSGYLVPRADGRIIAGSTVEFCGFDKQVTAEGASSILSAALQLAPGLSSATIDSMWAGFRPYTDDHLPILGEGPIRGLFLATGHFRNGILLAPVTAQITSELVLRKPLSVDLRPFSANRFLIRQPSSG